MKKGLCNICGAAGPLTRDHIFPVSTVPFDTLEVRTLAAHLSCGLRKSSSFVAVSIGARFARTVIPHGSAVAMIPISKNLDRRWLPG